MTGPIWTNKSDTVCIYDEAVSRAPLLMHDASRPFVVMIKEHRDYRRGGGTQWRSAGRYESLQQAKARAYRA